MDHTPFQKVYGSKKFGGKCALKYELVVSAYFDQILWVNGPFPAGMNDKRIFSEYGLLEASKERQETFPDFRIIADAGYKAEKYQPYLSLRNEFDDPEVAYFKDRALSRHESLNRLTKNFRCMVLPFRHDRGTNINDEFPRHKACLEAICVTIQYEFDLGIKSLLMALPVKP